MAVLSIFTFAQHHPNRLSLSLASTAALALASLPLAIRHVAAEGPKAEGTEAADLGVIAVTLRDAIIFNYGFQGALQGAGTHNQAGLGAFIPLHVSSNTVACVDVLVNANFNDYGNYSSNPRSTPCGLVMPGHSVAAAMLPA
ncbi:hypothetical protein [Synechococcus sp. CBW1108]|uniref:hypothetical protein n=1 Tax=Synechococcus sp. CBW1108 TaxID=1353147 RepID=UPI0018CE3CC2|nr:hypothetical protein [Synechococcus sp. CBW1108]QPN68928.1 hypothetical protein H8F27_09595 [Synechococcus sp. CBW1108]